MKIIDSIKNNFFYRNKYKTDSEAVIIACYFNPQNNPYRLIAFKKFYESIKHLNHRIVECVVDGSSPELNFFKVGDESYSRVYTKNLLWHKEALLNGIIAKLPTKFKYVFWVDADVIFTNKDWLIDSVSSMQNGFNIVQPFEYCVHLDQDQTEPSFDLLSEKRHVHNPKYRHPKLWRSFGANHAINLSADENYDRHGHVGFAWGARREVLDAIPLYDKALVGGADHIIAHAAAGQINHTCITKSFTDDIVAVNIWSRLFYAVVRGKIGYVPGDLYHIWHGDIAKRQYLKRVQEFTSTAKEITEKDANGLYITDDDSYVKEYMKHRESTGSTENNPVVSLDYQFLYPETQKKHNIVPDRIAKNSTYGAKAQPKNKPTKKQIETKRVELRNQYPNQDDSFIESMLIGYMTDSTLMGSLMGGNMMGAMVGDMLNNTDPIDGLDTMLDDNRPVGEQLDSMLNDNRPVSEQLDSMLNGDTTTSDNFS
jgi:hypothetical protein